MFECEYFIQQLFNEVRRTIMLDYIGSREQFIEFGDQFSRHLNQVSESWIQFNEFYHDANNQRGSQDKEFEQNEYIGEELDWKMIAENMDLYKSELGDLQDMQGFDLNISIVRDQSICQTEP